MLKELTNFKNSLPLVPFTSTNEDGSGKKKLQAASVTCILSLACRNMIQSVLVRDCVKVNVRLHLLNAAICVNFDLSSSTACVGLNKFDTSDMSKLQCLTFVISVSIHVTTEYKTKQCGLTITPLTSR